MRVEQPFIDGVSGVIEQTVQGVKDLLGEYTPFHYAVKRPNSYSTMKGLHETRKEAQEAKNEIDKRERMARQGEEALGNTQEWAKGSEFDGILLEKESTIVWYDERQEYQEYHLGRIKNFTHGVNDGTHESLFQVLFKF